ncbi:preprotein translocase subunit SecE [Desulfothermobacter acidiphilus]|uniref:preprotein translocase subunit SecE n=1 Tax=Desulfothermobacter acidiphilus TaxID=1938353 RepID=UPI003F896297
MAKPGKNETKNSLPGSDKLVPLRRPRAKAGKENDRKGTPRVVPEKGKAAVKTKAAPKKKFDLQGSITKTREFLLSVWQELKKVYWPTRKQVLVYTGVVLVAVAMVTLIIWLADSVFSQILRFILKV